MRGIGRSGEGEGLSIHMSRELRRGRGFLGREIWSQAEGEDV